MSHDLDLIWVLETEDGSEHKVSLIEVDTLWEVSYLQDFVLLVYKQFIDRVEALIYWRKVKKDVRAGKYYGEGLI